MTPRRTRIIHELRRHEESVTELVTERLDADSRVEHVPVMDDLALELTDLGGDHVARVYSGLEGRYHTVFGLETLPVRLDLVLDQEEHSDTDRFLDSGLHLPREDDLIADVLVDLGAGLENWLGHLRRRKR